MATKFQDKYVFAQLTAFLNRTQFNNYVRKYDGNRYVKNFTCWNQLLAMMFGQLSNRESLRDLIVALEAHRAKQYHLGLGHNTIVKATLAYANQTRDYRIFVSVAIITYCLVAIVHHDMQLKRSTYEVLQILSISLTDKTHLRDLFDKTIFNDVKLDYPLFKRLFD